MSKKLRVMLEQKSDAEKERRWRGAEDERGEEEGSREKRKWKCLPWLSVDYDEQNCLDKAFVRNVIMSANAFS